ncbi:hypothetical protein BS78_03G155700 [Paspalum vaginatum]|nr:hypothetical protein BS78_03G155700 [Paspalum vaginatum]
MQLKVMHRFMLRLILITNDFQGLRLEAAMKAYVRNQLLTSAAIYLAFVCCLSILWLNVSSLVEPLHIPWSQIRRSGAYVKAALLIVVAYATLLVVNTRYISLFIMPIIMLVFIGALFVVVTQNGSHRDRDSNDAVVSVVSPVSEEADGNNGVDKDNWLFLTAVLPCWLLFCTGHLKALELVVSQFLLFLSASLGELTLMMASLPSQVSPAFEAVHGASLVVVLVTAHTMAAELLGDVAVLVCTPELVAALLWLTIHLGHGGSATVSTVAAALRRADIMVLGAVLGAVAVLAYPAPIRADESSAGAATNDLLSSYMSALVACAFSVILLSLCVFALHQWRCHATVTPSSELEGAIRLLSCCRDILLNAVAIFLLVKPLVDVQLCLELQGLATDIYIWAVSKVTGFRYLATTV